MLVLMVFPLVPLAFLRKYTQADFMLVSELKTVGKDSFFLGDSQSSAKTSREWMDFGHVSYIL